MTPQYSVGAEQVAAHLKACTESREELLAALKEMLIAFDVVDARVEYTDSHVEMFRSAGVTEGFYQRAHDAIARASRV